MYKPRAAVALFLLTSGVIVVVSLLLGYKDEYTGIASRIGGVKLAQDYLSSGATAIKSSSASISAAGASVPGFNDALQSCRVTDLPNDPLVKEYGQNNIRLSRTYEGSGTRVRKVMEKALRGEKIKIAVVGGSVSAGHAVPWPWTAEGHMYKRIQKWFQDTFPSATHSLNVDSTIPAVSAWYFSYCVLATLPEDADLIFLELDINQWPPEEKGVLENTERLFRTLLDLPHKPALVYLSVFGLVFNDMTHGWRSSAVISQWLDVPEISMRNWYLPHLMEHPEAMPYLFKAPQGHMDKRHINGHGHRALADMTIGYLREQLCLVQRNGPVMQEPSVEHWPGNYITEQLPRLSMISKWSENGSIPLLHPRCETVSSKTMPLTPASMDGWELVNRNDKKSYEATEPGSIITFNVNVIEGQVGLFVWKTPFEGFGELICWMDGDDREDRKKVVKAFTTRRPAASFEHTGDMFKGLTPGNHILSCRSKTAKDGGNTFRISAVVAR